ncbi:MAG: lysylphosphatidylglycerol synthase transmembrane domain-containing protein, partial [Geminicoccaceae bacterium]|nr:lysylphosphatidylglycerol synthase transmembrane domain-containing protein [Geminicoccaceae bacterium]
MNRILRAALSGVVLLLLFSFVPLTSVTAALGGIGAGWLALATVVAALELVTRSVRLGILTAWHRMPLSTAAIVEINLISGFYALFLPGELAGGALRWYRMSRPSGQRAEALAAIGFARLVDTIGLVALGALFFLLDRPPLGSGVPLGFLGALAALLALLVLSLNRPLLGRLLGRLERLSGGGRLMGAAGGRIGKVVAAVGAYRTLTVGPALALVALTVARHLLSGSTLYVCMAGLGLEIGWVSAVWISMLVNVAVMLPFTLAGIGVREGLLTLLLVPYGVAAGDAVALGLMLLAIR